MPHCFNTYRPLVRGSGLCPNGLAPAAPEPANLPSYPVPGPSASRPPAPRTGTGHPTVLPSFGPRVSMMSYRPPSRSERAAPRRRGAYPGPRPLLVVYRGTRHGLLATTASHCFHCSAALGTTAALQGAGPFHPSGDRIQPTCRPIQIRFPYGYLKGTATAQRRSRSGAAQGTNGPVGHRYGCKARAHMPKRATGIAPPWLSMAHRATSATPRQLQLLIRGDRRC